VLLLAFVGTVLLAKKLFQCQEVIRLRAILMVVVLPLAIQIYSILFELDHFPRHMVPLIPWMAMTSAWSLAKLADLLKSRGLRPAIAVVPVFLYLGFFVYDGERVFFHEPRNEAARWLQKNVTPGTEVAWTGHNWIREYRHVDFPEIRPPFLVVEMHTANHYVSGMGWKNSFPGDYRRIFASRSQARINELQSIFKATSEYREVARFSEGYFMPEYTLADRLIGNRSRNYVAEIVIFQKGTMARPAS